MVLPRHQTLRAAIDWSYHLLSETERVVLRRLSVFAGGFTLDAAESVCQGGNVEAASILDLLTSLVDKSLVLAETRRGESRYRLLETVRQYARDRLVEGGEEAEVRTRHQAWCVTLAEQADAELRRPRQRVWLERLEVEHDNMRAALAWSREDLRGAEAALRLVGALFQFWWLRGNWREVRGWSEEPLKRQRDAPRAVLPMVYVAATQSAWRLGDYERAKMLGEEGFAIARDLGDKWGSAMLLLHLGMAATLHMADGQAGELYEQAVRVAREVGDEWLVSVALNQQGILACVQGDLGLATTVHEEALALMRETGDTAMVSYILRYLGRVPQEQGDYQRAGEVFRESLRLSDEAGFRFITLECLVGLACVSSDHAQHDRAARLFAVAEAQREAIGQRDSPVAQANYDRRLASTRSGLGEAAFAAAWAEGRAMTLEQAIEYALADQPG